MPGLPSTPGGPGAPCLTCSASLAMMELSLQPQTPPPFFGFRKNQSIKMITTKYVELFRSGAKSEVSSSKLMAFSFDQSREEENKLGQSTSQSVE